MSSSSDLSALLLETRWVRRLARSLADDAALAEDLVQDAWVAALEHRPDSGRPLRGWLATVLRRRWSDLRRESVRREAREAASAREEAQPGADEIVLRASIQRRLVDAVLELDEPYRSTVLLRYFEGLSQREIARRTHTTSATVNSRLTRALEKLRARLGRHGGPTTWLQVLVPLLREPVAAPALLFGVAVKQWIVAIVAVIALLGGVVLWKSPDTSARAEPPDEPAVAASAPFERTDPPPTLPAGVAAATAAEPRIAVAVPPSESSAPASEVAAPLGARSVRGRVLDTHGAGLAGVPLESGADVRSTSGPGGWFELQLTGAAETIVCSDPSFETVLAGSTRVAHDTTPTFVVVAPRIRVDGVVVDPSGAPLPGAWVELRAPRGFGSDWGLVLDFSAARRWHARTGSDGRFELTRAPALAGATLEAALGGYAPRREPAPQVDALGLELVLRRPSVASGVVRGVVLDPLGLPVEGAYVSAGRETSISGRDGEFALDVAHAAPGAALVALKAGFTPARFAPELESPGSSSGASSGGAPRWPDEVVLQLGAEPGRVRGRVVDHARRPVAGARVWLDDVALFGFVGDTRRAVEPLLAGDERFWSFVVSGADGGFELDGLALDRTYGVRAIEPKTLVAGALRDVRAGELELELRLATDELLPRVAGRIVTRRGEPLAGIDVRLFRETFVLAHEDGRDNESVEGERVLTGADGSFEFTGVPREDVWLLATGDAILGEGASVAEAPDPAHLEIVASLRLHVQVELAAPVDRADAVEFRDAAGDVEYASLRRAGGSHMASRFGLIDGRSDVLAIGEDVATLVLLRGELEVARVPLRPKPGEIEVVRY